MLDGLHPTCKDCKKAATKARRVRLASRTPEEVLLELKKKYPSGLKRCHGCKKDLPFASFGKALREPSGLRGDCFECSRVCVDKSIAVLKQRTLTQLREDAERLHPEGGKTCRYCRCNLPLNNFAINRRKWDGLEIKCNACQVLLMRDRRAKVRQPIVDKLMYLYGDTCLFPGCEERENLHIDHVMPLALGGPDEFDNYQLLCQHHNCSKGATYVDYRVKKGRNGTSK